MRALVLNGPNLDMLGRRQPDVYGSTTLSELEASVSAWGESLGVEVEHRQSNHEGELIEAIHDSTHDGIIINPGALTHTSRALADAVSSVSTPAVEVHISNILEREPWRAQSVMRGVAAMSIYGRGVRGYRDALRHLVNRGKTEFEEIRYGPHPEQVGDLRRAGSDLVLLVHGGFWRHEWTRDTMETLAVDLHQRGMSTWNIEYRRIGAGGGWPGSAHDVAMALAFAPQLEIGEGRLTLVGHSAGGHLGLWAAGRTDELDLVVTLSAITDLARHATSGLFGAAEARHLLDGGAPSTPFPAKTDLYVVHGEDDSMIPSHHSTDLAEAHGAEAHIVPGGHFELLDPTRGHWEKVAEALAPA